VRPLTDELEANLTCAHWRGLRASALTVVDSAELTQSLRAEITGPSGYVHAARVLEGRALLAVVCHGALRVVRKPGSWRARPMGRITIRKQLQM
jgi:hypothetical protein